MALHPSIIITIFLAFSALPARVASTGCPGQCTKYGTCNAEVGRCDCPRHRTGPDCKTKLSLAALAKRCGALGYGSVKSCISTSTPCLNGCNGKGQCVLGFCQCRPGFFGADCSLSMGRDGKPAVLADRGYRPRSRGPRVYMYDLPPYMTSWRNEVNLDRPTTRLFTERLTATGARVGDGDKADWYFIPVTLRRTTDSVYLRAALEYIRDQHTWWNKTQGHRHFVIALGDMGRFESERSTYTLSANVTFVSHWGLTVDKRIGDRAVGWEASHRPSTDIVLPAFLTFDKLARMGIFISRNHPRFQEKAPMVLRDRDGPTFFFAGRICGDHSSPRSTGSWPICKTSANMIYSGGTRQKVYFHHSKRKGYFIQLADPEYGRHLLTSKYCFGPSGGGHGQRQLQAVLAGCVPVVISDGVLEAFEPYLDWNSFGVRVSEADIPRLHVILGAITPQEYERKVAGLRCAAMHMAFSNVMGAYMGEDGRYDAFETLLEILRAKAAHPDAAPEQLIKLDSDFKAFMECRDMNSTRSAVARKISSGSAVKDRGCQGGGASRWRHIMAMFRRKSYTAANEAVQPLCSVSPFDLGEPGVVLCKPFRLDRPLPYGGEMCATQPGDLAACPRPWQ